MSQFSYTCSQCHYLYDPAEGDPDSGIEPTTFFQAIDAQWCCPQCGANKDEFVSVETEPLVLEDLILMRDEMVTNTPLYFQEDAGIHVRLGLPDIADDISDVSHSIILFDEDGYEIERCIYLGNPLFFSIDDVHAVASISAGGEILRGIPVPLARVPEFFPNLGK